MRLAALAVLGLWIANTWAEPPRTISLAPHLTELAYAAGAGDRLVGTVAWSDYPPEALELPLIGDAFRYDLEAILNLDPDHALAWRGGSPVAAVERVGSLGIEIVWIETRTLDDIAQALETLGDRLGRPRSGREAAKQFRSDLESLQAAARGDAAVRVFYQVSARPLYTLGGRHVINEVFERCGMQNIFGHLQTEAAVVDLEAVLTAQPDLIIAGQENDNDRPLSRWKSTRLVEDGVTDLHLVDATLLVRPTPRILQGIEFVCSLAR